ncbi:MAG: hypothetical protein MMC23_002820 [Stictis urceolatum]|nr:hypothetical protein [Stictis urceolata]
MNEHPFSNVVTTEIEITHESRPMAESAGPVGISDIEAPADYSVQVQAKEQPTRPLPDALRMRTVTREVASNEPNAEAWLYARVAILFFIALLVTWIPSSVNRLYALARPTHVNFGLNYVSSFVFPLQGFWNVLVYIITSQTACRRLWADLSHRSRTAHLGGNLTGGKNVGKRLGDGTPGMGRGQRLQSLSSLSG